MYGISELSTYQLTARWLARSRSFGLGYLVQERHWACRAGKLVGWLGGAGNQPCQRPAPTDSDDLRRRNVLRDPCANQRYQLTGAPSFCCKAHVCWRDLPPPTYPPFYIAPRLGTDKRKRSTKNGECFCIYLDVPHRRTSTSPH
jgi:hypothetical protein